MQEKAFEKLGVMKNKSSIIPRVSKIFLGLIILLSPIATNFSAKNVKAEPSNLKQSNLFSKKSFVAEAVALSGPSVVTIETERKIISYRNRGLPPQILIDPYFERFFAFPGLDEPRSRIEKGQGSGVIFSEKGFVLTNAHVVEKSDQLTVGLSDGRRVEGKVIGIDLLTDLAVIKLTNSDSWPVAKIGDSNKLSVGDWAIAVGNPYGLEKTVTLGIISNLNRNVSQLGIGDKRLNLIQTDAAINPGNSGGPLLNSSGEVIGINTMVRNAPGAGLGFAIPINKAISIANQLVEFGRAKHPIIGVSLSISNKNVSTNDTNKDFLRGALVRYIVPGSPAEKAGLEINDLIINVGKKKVNSPSDVVNEINKNGIKNKIKFLIIRKDKEKSIFIKPIDIHELKPAR